MLKRQTTERLGILFFVIAMAIFVQSLWGRIIHIDDVWLGEYSYWLNKIGYVKSEAMRGFFSAEDHLFVYHKFFNIQGAWFIHWFGFKPYVLKSISLIYLAGTFVLLHLLYKKWSDQKTNTFLLWALFLSFFHTMNLGFTFRPELQLVFWGLLSFHLMSQYFESGKVKLLILAAFFSGLGIATHLNGVVFTGASVLFLWLHRRWYAGFFFGLIATWGVLFFVFYDVRSMNDLHLLYLQLTNWRDVATGEYGWLLFFRVFMEQGRYLHSPPEIIYTALLLMTLIPAGKYLYKTKRHLLVYTSLLFLCVAHATHGQNTNYLMYACPFLVLLALLAFEHLLVEGRRKLAWSAVGIFLIGSWQYDISEFSHKEAFFPQFSKVAEFLPANAKVLSAHFLIFPGIEKLRIQSFITYRDKVENKVLEKNAESMFQEAQKFDIEYVVVDPSNNAFFNVDKESYGPYSQLSNSPVEGYKIFKRQK